MMQICLIYTLLILCYSLSVVSVTLSPCARWNPTAITVAGTGESGNSAYQLFDPSGIFILKRTNTLYVADSQNMRIQMFSLDQSPSAGVTVVSTSSNPRYVYVDDDNDGLTIYASLLSPSRVEKWVNGTSSGEQVGKVCRMCAGVSVDQEKNVYIGDTFGSCVLKWSPQTKTTTIVAGQCNITGSSNNRLSYPAGIYLDRNTSSLYVVDTGNQRIHKWLKDAEDGITVAGLGVPNQIFNAESRMTPQSVLVDDETKVVYLTDLFLDRIRRWLPGASKSDTIAGGKGVGSGSDQLISPFDLAFDNEYNLYVSDSRNHRVQCFALIDNQPCSEISTVNSVVETTTQSISPPPTTLTTTKTTAQQLSSTLTTTTTTQTTTMENSAVSSQGDRHSRVTMIIATLSIVLWMNTVMNSN